MDITDISDPYSMRDWFRLYGAVMVIEAERKRKREVQTKRRYHNNDDSSGRKYSELGNFEENGADYRGREEDVQPE